jgi:hypothetical protein
MYFITLTCTKYKTRFLQTPNPNPPNSYRFQKKCKSNVHVKKKIIIKEPQQNMTQATDLMLQLRSVSQSPELKALGLRVESESVINEWDVIFDAKAFSQGSPLLHGDLTSCAPQLQHIRLRITFPSRYPVIAPFCRIVRPRFKFHTGHVTIGGSICTDLLTSTGWQRYHS